MSYDLFDLVLKNWDRPMREAYGYKVLTTERGYQLVLNTLGIRPEDIDINLNKDVLAISGKTENKTIEFTNSVNYKFNIHNIKNDLLEVNYEVQDGLTVVDLILKKNKADNIKIKRK